MSWALTAWIATLPAQSGPVSVGLPALLSGTPPTLTGGGTLSVCQGEPRPLADFEEVLGRIEGHLNYGELDAAGQALTEAREVALCLGEPLPGNLVARVSFLAGIRAWFLEDRSAAEGHFLEALRLRESLAWDPTFPPEMRQPFEVARQRRAEDPSSWLRVVPALAEGRLWVDGLPVDEPQVSLGPGLHYVQLGGATWTTFVVDLPPAGASVLWLPSELDEGVTTWVEDPERRDDLDGLLQLALPEGTAIALTTDAAVWRGRVGSAEWAPVERVRHPWRWAGLGGLALAGGSLVAAGTGYAGAWVAASDSHSARQADDWTDYQAAGVRHGLAGQIYRVGLIGAGVGTTLAAVCFGIDRWALGVGTAQGGPTLQLGRRW